MSPPPDTIGIVAATEKISICSCGAPVAFFMIGCDDGKHVEAAVRKLMQAISRPGRPANVYNAQMLEAEFEDRVNLAAEGKLKPSDHVVSINGYPELEMFEIRWVKLPISTRTADGGIVHEHIDVRLYYVDGPWYALGLHAHEKQIFDNDDASTLTAQDVEIDQAVSIYAQGFGTHWGVGELN